MFFSNTPLLEGHDIMHVVVQNNFLDVHNNKDKSCFKLCILLLNLS